MTPEQMDEIRFLAMELSLAMDELSLAIGFHTDIGYEYYIQASRLWAALTDGFPAPVYPED